MAMTATATAATSRERAAIRTAIPRGGNRIISLPRLRGTETTSFPSPACGGGQGGSLRVDGSVPGSADGSDVARIVEVFAQFVPESADMDVDRPLERVALNRPIERVEQNLARQDSAFRLHEGGQQSE